MRRAPLAALVALALLLSGCGGAPAESAAASPDGPAAAPETAAPAETATPAGTILAEGAGVSVTFLGFEETADDGPALVLRLENRAAREMTMECADVSVNGYMMPDACLRSESPAGAVYRFEAAIPAGTGHRCLLTFSPAALDAAGIGTPEAVEFRLRAADGEAIYESGFVSVRTGAADTGGDAPGVPVYEGGGVRILALREETDAVFGACVYLRVDNDTEGTVYVTAEDALFEAAVAPGKREVAVLGRGVFGEPDGEPVVSFLIRTDSGETWETGPKPIRLP